MKLKFLLLFYFFLPINLFAQNLVKMTSHYGSDSSEINDLMEFENIYIETLYFKSDSIRNKFYEINIREYKNGKFIRESNLFDGQESDYFKVNSHMESVKFFFSIADGRLKTFVRGRNFGSKKSYFKLFQDSDDYALKDFFGNKKEIEVPIGREFPAFAILTPMKHNDGSASYCEVVQSNIKPEELGEYFHIPHYFIVMMKFK